MHSAKIPNAYSKELLTSFQQPKEIDKVGFLLHGRFANFPTQLIYELHRNLLEDIRWTQQYKRVGSSQSANTHSNDEDDGVDLNEIKQFQSIEYFLLVANCSFTDDVNTTTLKPFDSVLGWNSVIFHNFEDEYYFQEADLAIIGHKHDFYKSTANSFPIIMKIPVKKLDTIVNSMKDLIQ